MLLALTLRVYVVVPCEPSLRLTVSKWNAIDTLLARECGPDDHSVWAELSRNQDKSIQDRVVPMDIGKLQGPDCVHGVSLPCSNRNQGNA